MALYVKSIYDPYLLDLSTAIDLIEGMAECEDDDLMVEAWQFLIAEPNESLGTYQYQCYEIG